MSGNEKANGHGKSNGHEHIRQGEHDGRGMTLVTPLTGSREATGDGGVEERVERLATAIESLLFVSGRPLERGELRKLLDVDDATLARSLQVLEHELERLERGIRLQRLGEQVQLVTAPENARYVAALLGLPMTAKLTTAALETLSVIAYRQPVTRGQIEAVRGVNSDRALVSLVQHGLVAEVGRAQTVGRPALFATTSEFLQQFGLTSIDQLPHTNLASPGQEQHNGSQASLSEHGDGVMHENAQEDMDGNSGRDTSVADGGDA
ncbi:MAG TPA: SMC-Scp complex subunit ScpB [Ktedonobacteraceae bacterium]|nr:SMC-Scp complex subunit ScpB [Ktedonobacteraceae bacterium]